MTEPTDAEIWQLWMPMARKGVADPVEFARAALARWGTPAGAGEVVACTYGDNGYACCEGGPCQADVHNASITTPQPTQAQAGAVPLTDEQSHALLERMATEADQWAEGLSYEPTREQLSGWCVAFIQREIQAAHGIKGADHG